MDRIRLAIDFEHDDPAWWQAGGSELWDGITGGMEESAVILEAHLAESWLAQARRIPGWADGPAYAPHPIAARPAADDEDE